MHLSELAINTFRCLDQVQIIPSPGVNLILGNNGEGKTSILEAIYCLSRGRSFRAKQLQKLIQDEQAYFVVRAQLQSEIKHSVALQVSRGTSVADRSEEKSSLSGNFLAKIDGQEAKTRVELNRMLPSILLDPAIHKLIEEGPKLRRQYLDWGVFHVEPQFIQVWRRYQRALKQRNQGLKSQISASQIKPWNDLLLETGEFIHQARQDYLAHIAILTQELASNLLGKEVKLAYRAGWAAGQTFAEALEKSSERERKLGTTVVGPHRADLVIQVGGEDVTTSSEEIVGENRESKASENSTKFHSAKQRVSRGQQKLIASSLMLAQAEHFKEHSGTPPIMLIDDPFAELDNQHAAKLLEKIADLGAQSFITALNPLEHPLFENARKFHVEHSSVNQL